MDTGFVLNERHVVNWILKEEMKMESREMQKANIKTTELAIENISSNAILQMSLGRQLTDIPSYTDFLATVYSTS